MRTALAADEPQPSRFATIGIVPAGTPPITLSCDGYVIPREQYEALVGSAGNVTVTLDLTAARAEQQFMRDLGWLVPGRSQL